MRKRIAILGSTGSIGANTLRVVSSLKGDFKVVGLSADSNIELLAKQSAAFRPKIISVGNGSLAKRLKDKVSAGIKIAFGAEGLNEIVCRGDVDLVVFAISGSSCLIPLVEAIEKKKAVALANKEALVSAGSIIMKKAREKGGRIVPIDSEHSAIFQCLEGKRDYLYKIYLTGTGGPLLNIPKDRFDRMPKKFILRHPKWKMGRKITVDSATMMNKGLEIIEARWLFDIDEKYIEVLMHPEAVIHSMVELVDGAIFAQLGVPDMRLPIQYALTYPTRMKRMVERLNFDRMGRLTIGRPDLGKFPCLRLAREALKAGGTYPAVLNAADEEAVKNYLDGRIRFSDIPKIIEKVLERHKEITKVEPEIEQILEAEDWARTEAGSLCYQ